MSIYAKSIFLYSYAQGFGAYRSQLFYINRSNLFGIRTNLLIFAIKCILSCGAACAMDPMVEGPLQNLPQDVFNCIVRTTIGGLPYSKNFTPEACQDLAKHPRHQRHFNTLKLVNKRFEHAVKEACKFFENPENVFAVFLVESKYNHVSFHPHYILNDSIKIARTLGFNNYVRTNKNFVHLLKFIEMQERIISHIDRCDDCDDYGPDAVFYYALDPLLHYYRTYWSVEENREHLDPNLVDNGSPCLFRVLKYRNELAAPLFIEYLRRANVTILKDVVGVNKIGFYRNIGQILCEPMVASHFCAGPDDHDEDACARAKLIVEKYIDHFLSPCCSSNNVKQQIAHSFCNMHKNNLVVLSCKSMAAHLDAYAKTGNWPVVQVDDPVFQEVVPITKGIQRSPWFAQILNDLNKYFNAGSKSYGVLIPYIKTSTTKDVLHERIIAVLVLINRRPPVKGKNILLAKVIDAYDCRRLELNC